jgi:putative heme-binding domain-containing protein
LDSEDWQLRHAARIALERFDVERWGVRAVQETRRRAAIEVHMALLRSGKHEWTPRVLNALLQRDPASLDLSVLMGWTQCLTMVLDQPEELWIDRTPEIIQRIETIFPKLLWESLMVNRCGTSHAVHAECARLLARLGSKTVVASTLDTLLASPVQEHRIAGLLAVRNVGSGWNDDRRRKYFQALDEGRHFLRGEGMEKFLKQIRDDAIATLSEGERSRLSDLLNPVDSQSAIHESPSPRPAKHQWTMNELSPLLTDASHKPNRERGKAVFVEAQCNRCHRSGDGGMAIGPDLTHVANRFSKKDLLRSILEPSYVIAENYRNAHIITSDGRTILGRLLIEGDYRSETISLATDPFKLSGNLEISKSEIEEFRESAVSPMPSGLVDGFDPAEILDLLEYLQGNQVP